MSAEDDAVLMASIARSLAEALCNFARDRGAEQKLQIARLQSELCQAWRAEQAAIAQQIEGYETDDKRE